ncbi:hypothetical protein Tco_1379017, partial [Tanacetum coccineum]
METMNVTFDELSAMAFEQSSSKPGLQSMTSGQISTLEQECQRGYDRPLHGLINARRASDSSFKRLDVWDMEAIRIFMLKKALYGLKASTKAVHQSPRGIFINQSNYVLEILKKYGMETCDPVGTPMEIKDKLDLDQNRSRLMLEVKTPTRVLPVVLNSKAEKYGIAGLTQKQVLSCAVVPRSKNIVSIRLLCPKSFWKRHSFPDVEQLLVHDDQDSRSIMLNPQRLIQEKAQSIKVVPQSLMNKHFLKEHLVRSAKASNDDKGEVKINATIDEIFEQLALMGYHTDSDKLTFQKGAFSPQWRFLIHCILHCLSPKKTAWEQFSSNIAAAVICLATNRKFNFSKMIFEHMRHQLQQHTRIYPVPSLSMKVFNNMKRPTKGYSSQEVALFPTMINVTAPSTSPSRITSSPSYSPEHSPSPTPLPSPKPTPAHTPSPT